MNKKLMVMTTAALAAAVALAAPRNRKQQVAVEEDAPTTGKEAKITIDQFPRLGRQATLAAPSVAGGTVVGTG